MKYRIFFTPCWIFFKSCGKINSSILARLLDIFYLGRYVKTTWLPQLQQDMCLTAQGLLSALSAKAVAGLGYRDALAKLATVAGTISKRNDSDGIIRTVAKHVNTRNEQSNTVNFTFNPQHNHRIRRSALQVAGAN
ncbi:hypothetical protein [Undibacterium pigrum]|uniref:hypothetical protein n=1 Tax=Undibacterium pigrum TaxID=401470 RepID=UPI000D7654E8|nr:hypothetical protein [Undibacterium pigrum]